MDKDEVWNAIDAYVKACGGVPARAKDRDASDILMAAEIAQVNAALGFKHEPRPAVKTPLSDGVRVYTRDGCKYCDYAKELLTERGIEFVEIGVGEDYVLRGWLAWATGQRTLPQVFISGEPIGGFADLMTIDATGELRRRVDQMKAKKAQGEQR